MKSPYDTHHVPPFPVVQVILVNGDEGLRTASQTALLDTGSDGTLVPLSHLQQINAQPLTDVRMRSHWGEWKNAQLFAVDVVLGSLTLPAIYVVGDDQGEVVIWGRNVLNRLRIILDGPTKTVVIPDI